MRNIKNKSGGSAGKRFFDLLELLLMHLTFIFSGMFITLWIFNLYNWQMEFLTSKLSNKLMIVYFVTAFLTAGLYIVRRAGSGMTKPDPSEETPAKQAEIQAEEPAAKLAAKPPSHRTKAVRTPILPPRRGETEEAENTEELRTVIVQPAMGEETSKTQAKELQNL